VARRFLRQRAHRNPAFSLLLGSIATSLGAACSLGVPVTDGAGGSSGGGSPVGVGGGAGGSTPNATVVATHDFCLLGNSLVNGLRPAVELDSLSLYGGGTEHLCTPPDYVLGPFVGAPCTGDYDYDNCLAEVERLRDGSADWGKYEDFWTASFALLVATGSQQAIARLGGPVETLTGDECGTWTRGVFPAFDPDEAAGGTSGETDAGGTGATGGTSGYDDSPGVGGNDGYEYHFSPGGAGGVDGGPVSENATTIADRETLLTLLGTIDTVSEGALVAWANNFTVPCSIDVLADGRYRFATTEQINDCPVTHQDYSVVVTPAGEVTSSLVGEARESDLCVGRRPHGLAPANDEGYCGSFEGAWLADVARLEAAAVVAFAQIVRQLERHGAPAELIERARVAALDEIRHARSADALATARGGQSQPAVVDLVREQSVLAMALENAVEGCIRECWGALVAHYQAHTAQDAAVREFFRTVAEEESAHALLSMDLADWFDTRLTEAEREQVAAARQQAIEELNHELGRDQPASAALGLPDRETRLALLRALEAQVWQPAAA